MLTLWEAPNLGQHHDLSARLVLFHEAMRLGDFVEVEGLADLDVQGACRDLPRPVPREAFA